MLELCASSVETWECDAMGHLNVQFYLARADEGLAALSTHFGHGPRKIRESGFGPMVTSYHIRFHREIRPGAAFRVLGALASRPSGQPEEGQDEDGATVYQEMRTRAGDHLVASFLSRVVLADLRAHERIKGAWPTPSSRIEPEHDRVEVPEHGRPRGLEPDEPYPSPSVERAEELGLRTIFRGVAGDRLCDPWGYVTPTGFMAFLSAGIPTLVYDLRGSDRSARGALGGAALEYRFRFVKPAQRGDLVRVMSGLKAIGNKTQTFCHWILDGDRGEAFATAEAVAVTLDLEARKAVPFSYEERTRLEGHLIPGLKM